MRISLLLTVLLSAYVVTAHPDEEEPEATDTPRMTQPEASNKAKMAPENARVVLDSVSEACYDRVKLVLDGEEEQKGLDEQCNKELMDGYRKTPMGELQSKEMASVQHAAFLRLGDKCREEFSRALKAQESGEEVAPPADPCVKEYQKTMQSMQQWAASTTVSKLSDECKKEAQSGTLSEACEQEFVALKPAVIETLNKQNADKEEEMKKEAAKPKVEKKQRVAKANPEDAWIDPNTGFAAVWGAILLGAIFLAHFRYTAFGPSSKLAKLSLSGPPARKTSKEVKREEKKQQKKDLKKNARLANGAPSSSS